MARRGRSDCSAVCHEACLLMKSCCLAMLRIPLVHVVVAIALSSKA